MGTTIDKINKSIQTKAEIKAAIELKGVDVGDIAYSQYPSKIAEINGGVVSGVIEEYLNSNNREYIIPMLLDILKYTVVNNDNTKTLTYLVGNNDTGALLFVDGCLPPTAKVAYRTNIISIRNVDFSGVLVNSVKFFGNNLNLIEFSGKSTSDSGEGITDFSAATNGEQMFAFNINLRNIAIFIPNIANTSSMFSDCYNLTHVTVKIKNQTISNAGYMFNRCNELQYITFTVEFKVSVVAGIFYMCYKLKTVNGIINITGVNSTTRFLDAQGANTIETIYLKGLSDYIEISSEYIKKECILYMFNNANVVTNKTITLRTSVYNQLTPEEIAIVTNKGFNVIHRINL